MKKYDIIVYFDADYLCTGSFYDSFEYFWMIRQKGYDVGFVIITPEGRGTVLKSMKVKYNVRLEGVLNDIYISQHKRNIPVECNIAFAPSMAAACQFYNRKTQMPFEKMITIMELPTDHGWMGAFTNEVKKDHLILYDERVFPEGLNGYEMRPYQRSLNFDIMSQPKNVYTEPTVMLNMVTNHKCYEPDELEKIIDSYDHERWVLFTKEVFWDKYYQFTSQREDIDIQLVPTDNYMGLFSHILYLPSKRGLDPSSRLLAEAKYFEKELIYHEFLKQTEDDGGFIRFMDVLSKFDNLKMTLNDDIFDIFESYR